MIRFVLGASALALAGAARADVPVHIVSSYRAATCSGSIQCSPGAPNENHHSEFSDSAGTFTSHLLGRESNFMCMIAADARSDQVSEVRPELIEGSGGIEVSAVTAASSGTAEAQGASLLDVTFSVDTPVTFRLDGETSVASMAALGVDSLEIALAGPVDTVFATRTRCHPDPTSGFCTVTEPFDLGGVLQPGEYRLRAQAVAVVRPGGYDTVQNLTLAWSVRLVLIPVVGIDPQTWTSIKQMYGNETR